MLSTNGYKSVDIFDLAIKLFIITNPIGNSPAILAIVRHYDFVRQKQILMREALFALLLALFFQFLGEPVLDALGIKNYALSLCGGVLILLVGIGMVFPNHPENEADEVAEIPRDPYLVPIATPLLSGAGLLTYIMIYAKKLENPLEMTGAILIAWVGVFAVLAAAPYLLRTFGKRGLFALEQLMGLVLSMIAVDMIIKGFGLFLNGL